MDSPDHSSSSDARVSADAVTPSQFPKTPAEAASVYLGLGLSPIPVQHRSKQPAIPWKDAKPTHDKIPDWFPQNEPRNVGLRLGQGHGSLIDLDLDCPEAMLLVDTFLPETQWVSGRKSAPRSHRWYRVTEPIEHQTFKDVDGAMLVELRSDGHFTVAPPSVHATGEPIEWASYSPEGPTTVSVGELQHGVCKLAAVTLLVRHWPGEGSRNDAFLALAGGLYRLGLEEDDAEQIVESIVEATGDEERDKRLSVVYATYAKSDDGEATTGWPTLAKLLQGDGQKVVDRVQEWLGETMSEKCHAVMRHAEEQKMEPYKAFPVNALPTMLREYVTQAAESLGCDPAYVALPALAVTASTFGNTRSIALKKDWVEPSVIWSVIVGESGTMKTPAFKKAVDPLLRIQEDLGTSRRVICTDTTIEKLMELLRINFRGLLLARDELTGWIGSFTRYRASKSASDLPHWLSMHTAGPVIVDRKTGDPPTLYVPRAAVSVTGSIQPAILKKCAITEFLESGLLARFLMAMPPKRKKEWTDKTIDPVVEGAYQGLLENLLKLECAKDDRDRNVPVVLPLSSDAAVEWIKFYGEWANEQNGLDGGLEFAYAKLEGYAARLALLHHVVRCVENGTDATTEIGVESIRAGIELARWFGQEARRIYSAVLEPAKRDTPGLMELIRREGGSVTVRDLMRTNNRKYPDARTAEDALNKLVESGAAKWEPSQTNGGRAARRLKLHDA